MPSQSFSSVGSCTPRGNRHRVKACPPRNNTELRGRKFRSPQILPRFIPVSSSWHLAEHCPPRPPTICQYLPSHTSANCWRPTMKGPGSRAQAALLGRPCDRPPLRTLQAGHAESVNRPSHMANLFHGACRCESCNPTVPRRYFLRKASCQPHASFIPKRRSS